MKAEIIINKFLFYVNFSHFTPFIRFWIVFLDWITKISLELFLKSKLTNIWYKDMQNLSSPSDCIQFSISDNERMLFSCIIHISDSRSSTAIWSWGIKTQTGFEYIAITKYIMIHYLSYKLTTSILQLCKFFHLAMQLRANLVFLGSLQFQSIFAHHQIIDISFYFPIHR